MTDQRHQATTTEKRGWLRAGAWVNRHMGQPLCVFIVANALPDWIGVRPAGWALLILGVVYLGVLAVRKRREAFQKRFSVPSIAVTIGICLFFAGSLLGLWVV